MPYCTSGQKPKVIYKFNNSQQRIYLSDYAPIDVSVKETQLSTGGQCANTYYIGVGTALSSASCAQLVASYGSLEFCDDTRGATEFYDFNKRVWASSRRLLAPVTFIQERFEAFNSGWWWDFYTANGYYTQNIVNGSSKPSRFKTLIREDGLIDNCGDPLKTCDLTITHNGITIFTDRGDCPCTFNVQCADCPEGTIKCDAPGYPGYCCLPCKEIAEEVKAIANQVRRFNNV